MKTRRLLMVAEEVLREIPDGFEGAVAGLTLPDVIQMNALNRFHGGITVQFGNNSGVIFFRDGEIIHAERGAKTGEPAFYEILQWPGGKFTLQPKVTTTCFTIRESWKFLLMEACRLLDESRNKPHVPNRNPDTKTETTPGGMGVNVQVTEKLMQVSGVTGAVLLGKDGIPVNNSSYEAENLAAQAMYVTMLGNHLGEILGVGETKGASIQGKSAHLLLFQAKNHLLSITVGGEHSVGSVETEIRKMLNPKK